MLTISDSVEIAAPAADVWRWLCDLPEHYTARHPAHHGCRIVQGRLWEPSAIVEMQEELHGRPHRLLFEVLEVLPGREIKYRAGPWLRGRFSVEDLNGHSCFTAELSFGLPGLGGILDRPLSRVFRRRISAVRQHQREEGANLKRLLEHDADAG